MPETGWILTDFETFKTQQSRDCLRPISFSRHTTEINETGDVHASKRVQDENILLATLKATYSTDPVSALRKTNISRDLASWKKHRLQTRGPKKKVFWRGMKKQQSFFWWKANSRCDNILVHSIASLQRNMIRPACCPLLCNHGSIMVPCELHRPNFEGIASSLLSLSACFWASVLPLFFFCLVGFRMGECDSDELDASIETVQSATPLHHLES